jgi:F0F1-type ATP synthase membrane subunit a
MIPFTITVTGYIFVTFFFSLTFFIAINLIAIKFYGFKLVNHFLPKGIPLVIMPFICLLEVFSYLARLLSLAIRLFSNMVAGHVLLKILISFI